MRRFVLVALLVACSSDKRGPTSDGRCSAFADRVVTCGMGATVTPALSEGEQGAIRKLAYAACTKSTTDHATLHYYGDVDRTIACMAGKDCDGVRDCLTATSGSGVMAP